MGGSARVEVKVAKKSVRPDPTKGTTKGQRKKRFVGEKIGEQRVGKENNRARGS